MLRVFAIVVLVTGLLALVFAGWILLTGVMDADRDPWIATGLWWFQRHPDSLQLLQPAIERHVSVWLFEAVVQPLLEAPLVWVMAGSGTVLGLLGWFGARIGR